MSECKHSDGGIGCLVMIVAILAPFWIIAEGRRDVAHDIRSRRDTLRAIASLCDNEGCPGIIRYEIAKVNDDLVRFRGAKEFPQRYLIPPFIRDAKPLPVPQPRPEAK
jgi:hypothetical protein